MRWIYLIILLLLVVAISVFAIQNGESITLNYFHQSVSCSPALLAGIVYLLGMVSGWTVVGLVQRWLRGVTEPPKH